jgi:hypothetical protein
VDFPDVRPIVVASHPRSGTHLLLDTLRRQFEACRSWKWPGERLDRLYCNIDELPGDGLLDGTTARRILQRTERPLVKTHSWPGYQQAFLGSHDGGLDAAWVDWLDEHATVFYVYRDGRDVLCSYQLFRQGFDPDARGPIGSFLRGTEDGTNRVRRWADHVQTWREQPDVHCIRFETLLNDPAAVIQRLADVIDEEPRGTQPLLPRPFSSIWDSRRARLFGVCPESTAIINGDSQDWEALFTAEDRAFFHEQAGDLLLKSGYESSADWASGSAPMDVSTS